MPLPSLLTASFVLGCAYTWCTIIAHWINKQISLLMHSSVLVPCFSSHCLQFSLIHSLVNCHRWIWSLPESREFSLGWQEQLAQAQCSVLRHAEPFHLRIPLSVPSRADVPASCKLSGNCASWHEVCSSRRKPLPSFLCLFTSLWGRLRAALALTAMCPSQTGSWCPPGSLCGSIFISAPGSRGKADPTPFLSCTAALLS